MATIYDLDVITSFNNTDQLYISQGVFQDKRIAVSAFLDSIESELSVVTLTGDQEIDGEKTFTEAIVADLTGDVTGNLTGNADTVTNGVYTIGDQTIGGTKTFSGIPAFNGGTTGASAPMTVDSTDVVTNLNADKLDGADLDTDGTLAGNSDTSVPTEKAVKTYADTKMSLTGNESVGGVKTFTSIPVLPASDPTTAHQAVRKAYLDGFKPQMASAWVNFDGTAAAASMIRDDYNVDSMTDGGTGIYTINIDVDLADTNYSVTFGTNGGGTHDRHLYIGAKAVGTCQVLVKSSNGTAYDLTEIDVHILGGV